MARLDRLLEPRSLAFVGGEEAGRAIDQCRALGYSGEMWAVHRAGTELRGIHTVRTPAELPGPPDAAFVAVNRFATVDVVAGLAALGAGAAVCYASGFAEAGPSGAALQAELLSAANGMPLIGPNCYGTLSALSGAALWPDLHGLSRCGAGVALLAQSGNITLNLTMQQRGIEFSHVLTLGNQADVGIEEAAEALVRRPEVTAVGLYIEALGDVGRFEAVAEAARRRNLPLVALKVGASQRSKLIAESHTSSLVGNDKAYDALFARLGVIRVHSIEQLLDCLHVLTTIGPLSGNRLVSLSCSGGEASLVADRAERHDVTFEPFEGEHRNRIAATLDGMVAVTNPLDYHTFMWGDSERLERCFTAVLSGPFDAALLVLDFPPPGLDRSAWWTTLEAFTSASRNSGTPGLVAASMAENMPADVRRRCKAGGLAALSGISAALRALEVAAAPARETRSSGLNLMSAPRAAPAGEATETLTLSEAAARDLLASAGIAVPRAELAPAGSALQAAARVGYPVVLKATGLAHKSDLGGVAMGLGDAAAVEAAADRLAGLSDSLLVESCVSGALVELLVDVRVEPPVGVLATLGCGGTLVEVLDDVCCVLLPESPEAIRAALERLRLWPLLAGHRGRPAAPVESITGVVEQLTQLVVEHPEIVEIEINPLLVTADRAVAVDALIRVHPASGSKTGLVASDPAA